MESSDASSCGTAKYASWVRKGPYLTPSESRCKCRQQRFSQKLRFDNCSVDGACADGFDNFVNVDGLHRHDVDDGIDMLSPSVWSFLPSELLERILACLPLASLFRFRAVCRSWNTAPFEPIFKSLRAVSMIPETWLVMQLAVPKAEMTATVPSLWPFTYNLEGNKHVALPNTFLPFRPDSGCFSYCTAAGGLICYHLRKGFNHTNHVENPVSLWVGNPFTKEWKCLPPTIGSFPPNFRLRGLVGMVALDSATDNAQDMPAGRRAHYKIIVRTGSQVGWGSAMMTEEYDSLTNAWRVTTMRDVPLEHRIEQVVHCNGFLYFLTRQAWDGFYAYHIVKQEWTRILPPKRTYQFTSTHMVECCGHLVLVSAVGSWHQYTTKLRRARLLQIRMTGIKLWMLVENDTTCSKKNAIADTERVTTTFGALRAWKSLSQMPKELVREFVTGVQFHCTSIQNLIYLTNGISMLMFNVGARMWRRVIIPQPPFLVQDFVAFAPKLEAIP